MTNITETTDQFSIDPAVLLAVTEVNHFPVIDIAQEVDGTRVIVLCHMGDNEYTPFVTWCIWRTETGKIAAEGGDYFRNLTQAIIGFKRRTGNLEGLAEAVKSAVREDARRAR